VPRFLRNGCVTGHQKSPQNSTPESSCGSGASPAFKLPVFYFHRGIGTIRNQVRLSAAQAAPEG